MAFRRRQWAFSNVSCDCVYRPGSDLRFHIRFGIPCSLRPNVKAAASEIAYLPRAPNSFALTKSAIKDVVRADVSLRPMRFGGLGIVFTLDEKTTDVIIAITVDNAIGKRQVKLHPVTIARLVVVKTNPKPGRVKLIAHKVV